MKTEPGRSVSGSGGFGSGFFFFGGTPAGRPGFEGLACLAGGEVAVAVTMGVADDASAWPMRMSVPAGSPP